MVTPIKVALPSCYPHQTTGRFSPPRHEAPAPPETTTIRLSKIPGICIAPQYMADELLRAEGLTDVRYVPTKPGLGLSENVVRGEIDFAVSFAPLLVIPIDASKSMKVLAGAHSGCFELFAPHEPIHSMLDLGEERG